MAGTFSVESAFEWKRCSGAEKRKVQILFKSRDGFRSLFGSLGSTVKLPHCPSVNHYYGRTKTGNLYLGKAGKAFRLEAHFAMREEKKRTGAPKYPILGPIAMEIHLYPPDKRRRDIDNPLKCILDALQHAGAFLDDSQITGLLIKKLDPCAPGWIEIFMEAL